MTAITPDKLEANKVFAERIIDAQRQEADAAKRNLERVKAQRIPRDSVFMRRWGCSLRRVPFLYGANVTAAEVDQIVNAARAAHREAILEAGALLLEPPPSWAHADLNEQPRPELPLSKTPKILQNAPNS